MRTFSWRPSPALLVAVLAVSIALVGTAAAGPIDNPIAQDSRLTKKDRRVAAKIARTLSLRFIKRFTPNLANRQITQRAPGLSVANADNATSADQADTVPDGAITTEKLADDAATGDKVNEATLGQVPSAASAANANALGGTPASGYAKRMFARVSYDAGGTSLIAASPGIVALNEAVLGFPRLSFPQSMNSCAVIGSAASSAGTQIVRRSTTASGTTVQFAINDEADTSVRSDFDVIAIC